MDEEQLVDAYLPVSAGATIPLDYRYLLYSMLKQSCRSDIATRGWQLLPIHGRVRGDLLHFHRDDGLHAIRVRLPLQDFGYLQKLANKPVKISQHLLILGDVVMHELRVSPVLHAEVVVVTADPAKGAKGRDPRTRGVEGVEFGLHVGKRLGAMLGRIDFGVEIGSRVAVHVAGQRLFGNSVTVRGLSDDESLELQRVGLGEKRTIGCGVFVP